MNGILRITQLETNDMISIKLGNLSSIQFHNNIGEETDWNITLEETGDTTQTGARIWNAKKYLEDCDIFWVSMMNILSGYY